MDIIKVIILGIVEGITEFLPISSTGHLILVNEFVNLSPQEFANAFNVIIQLGAILSVVVLYFEKLNPFSLNKIQRKTDISDYSEKGFTDKVKFRFHNAHLGTVRLWIKVVIAFLPAAVLGFLFDDLIDKYLFNPLNVAIALIAWGVVIIFIEKRPAKEVTSPTVNKITAKQALLIGFFQCFAMIPGTSRSAATIIGAMLIGTSRTAAAEFSFFLAIPTMLGATTLKIIKMGLAFTSAQWMYILLGSIVSYVVARIVIVKFMGYIKNNNFTVFGYYRIILGIVSILYLTLI